MNSLPEQFIRNHAKNGAINFSGHALQRMSQRKIWQNQVYKCIEKGEYVETQYHGKDVKVIFQEATSGKTSYYVVVAACLPNPEVVTVCLPEDEIWEDLEGLMKRRR